MPRPSRSRSLSFLAGLLVTAPLVLSACTSSGGPSANGSGSPSGETSGSIPVSLSPDSSPSPSSSAPPPPRPLKVHVQAYPGDGTTVGIGMPIIATFDRTIADAHGFVQHTTVTVNGEPAQGAWYFEYSDPASGHVLEAHYRPAEYWPGHAQIHVAFDLKAVTAGKKGKRPYVFDGGLTSLDFATGAANVLTVSNSTHKATLVSDGKRAGVYPVSLGASRTRTRSGVKVIMEKYQSICMQDLQHTYRHCGVKYPQRLTYDGEYLHQAEWNVYNINAGINSSNGCTNLLPSDAKLLYTTLQIGDVVDYPDADGPRMRLGDGYGDWNVPWGEWQTGGALDTQ